MAKLTVEELVAMRQLGCRTLAGAGGLDRTIEWAHVCELDDPWNWLAPGELLMTTGICVPEDEADQVEFVRHLSRVGTVGVAIGEELRAPELSAAMLAEGDALDYPILSVTHSTPFSAMGRTVAAAGQNEQISRLARLSRLYDVARSATIAEASLLERMSAELGYELHVVDVRYRTEVMPRARHLDDVTLASLSRLVEERFDRLPARVAVDVDGLRVATAFPLSTQRACMLVVASDIDVDLDAFVLLHAQSVIGVEVQRVLSERERNDDLGTSLLGQIIDGSIGVDAAKPHLESGGLGDGEWVVTAFQPAELPAVQAVLGDHSIPFLSCSLGEEGYALVPASADVEVRTILAPWVSHLGLSARSPAVSQIPDSIRQARWALQAARTDGSPYAEYSTATPLFQPRTISEAHLATRAVLGQLIDYDESHQSDLIDTLEAFLMADRSWSATAEQLMIHRQTLAYRLKKIEELSGRTTKGSADIATFWMALNARRIGRGGSV